MCIHSVKPSGSGYFEEVGHPVAGLALSADVSSGAARLCDMATRTLGAGAMTLRDWWMTGAPDPDRQTVDPEVMAEELAAAGIAAEDVAAFGARQVAAGLPVSFQSGRALTWDLRALSGCWPQMRVRDALGWALVFPRGGLLVGTVRPWVSVVGAGGWLFAAAGFSPAEARDLIATGEPVGDALVALAALRGVPLPVTT